MNGRTVLPAFALGRGRKAFALTEALILIVVVLVAIGGIFASIGYAVRMRSESQADLDGFLMAQSWFEALESERPENIKNQSMLNAAALAATRRLGGSALSSGRFSVGGMILLPVFGGTHDGAHLIELTINTPKIWGGDLRFSRRFNVQNSNTVQDNVHKRREK